MRGVLSLALWGLLHVALCACGCPDHEEVYVGGQAVVTTTSGESLETYHGAITNQEPGITGPFPDETAAAQAWFERVREATKDPEDAETRFGVAFLASRPDEPEMPAVLGRSIRLELAFPLEVGDVIEFRTEGQYSREGINAPFAEYTESMREPRVRIALPLRSARGRVTSTEPFEFDVELHFTNGDTLRGSLNLRYERDERTCDRG